MAVPRTRMEQVAGIRPPLGRVILHYAHELTNKYMPHPKWMLIWIGAGALFITTASVVTIIWKPHIDDQEARQKFKEAQARIEENRKHRKAEADLKARAEKGAKVNQDITDRAIANWEQWKNAFVGPNTGFACYHSHDFDSPLKVYKITCQLGPKGSPPNLTIVCDEHSCGTPPPPPPPKKKKKDDD